MSQELQRVLSLAEPLARSMGYEILQAEFTSERGDRILRIFLDKPAPGVTIEDCEQFSKALGTTLDVEADLPTRYYLEISSPGLNRPLVTSRHFAEQVGKIVQVQTEPDIEGRRNFKGELIEVSPEPEASIVLRIDGTDFRILLNTVKKAHLDYFASEAKDSQARPKGKKKSS